MKKRVGCAVVAALLLLCPLTGCKKKGDTGYVPVQRSIEEVQAITAPLLEPMLETYRVYLGEVAYDEAAPAPFNKKENVAFYRVTDERFSSMTELRIYTETAFSAGCASRAFYDEMLIGGAGADKLHFREQDGVLYVNPALTGTWDSTLVPESMTLIRQAYNTILVSYDLLTQGVPDGKAVVMFKRSEAGWRVDNTPAEAISPEYRQYLEPAE